MPARSRARKRAVDILFESDLRGTDPVDTLADRLAVPTGTGVPEYAVSLVEGVAEHRRRIDEILSSFLEGWTLERLPALDRSVLRLGTYELLWRDDIPDAVAIDEAVELAKTISTEDSPRYVNGVLSRILLARPVVR